MSELQKLILIFKESNQENFFLNLSLYDFLSIIFLFFIVFFIRRLLAIFILNKFIKILRKFNHNFSNENLNIFLGPIKILPFIVLFSFYLINFEFNEYLKIVLSKINMTLLSIFVFWILHSVVNLISNKYKKLEILLTEALTDWILNSTKYVLIFFGLVAVLEIWGIKIGPVIAGLGLFGVAVALGAQDLFKNLISGILILIEKRFNLGDVINVPNFGDGVVEKIGFRSTSIRKFDSTPVTIPNYFLSDAFISNFSNRKYRRINWVIALEYSTSVSQLKTICEDIESYINDSQDFKINEEFSCYVKVEKFNDSSIDLLVSVFTNTNLWSDYLNIKEKLILKIKNIVEDKHKAAFAFPTQTVFYEKNNSV